MESNEIVIKDPEAVLAALDRAKADAKKYREELEALQAEHEPLKERMAALEAENLSSAIKREIERAGADPERVSKFLNTEGISLIEGRLEGFDDAFKAVKEDLPELFDAKRRVGGAVELETNDLNVEKSVTEKQVDRLFAGMR